MKKYICGLCKDKNKRIVLDRRGLRKHLREEHKIMSEIAGKDSGKERIIQNWWITEEFE